MKHVGIREAQVNLTKLLQQLPFAITRYSKIVAVVSKPGEQTGEKIDRAVEKELTEEDVKQAVEELEEDKSKMKPVGWCAVHFERGVTYPLVEIEYRDEHDNVVLPRSKACPQCIEKYQKMEKDKGELTVYEDYQT